MENSTNNSHSDDRPVFFFDIDNCVCPLSARTPTSKLTAVP
jgi:hypothetical protein